MKIVFASYNERFWSGNYPDRNWLVVDIYKYTSHRPDVYFYSSMEG